MSGYVDIHAHVLPGIDDGPRDLDQSLEMARAAAASGIGTIAATPHLRHDFPRVHVEELAGRCETLRAAIDREQIPIEVVSGAEVSLAWAIEAGDDQLRLASYGQHGTDLLIETPTTNAAAIEAALPLIEAKGYRVTLAHPERALAFQRDPALLRPLVQRGLLLAVNADSLLAGRGSRSGRLGRRICTEGLAHVLASDGHRAARWRPVTVLERAIEAAMALVGPERAAWMAHEAPGAILAGVELPPAPAVDPARPRRRLFGRRS